MKINIKVFFDQTNLFIAETPVSSAYSFKSQLFTADFIPFTYNKKSIVPEMDPRGLHNLKHLVLRDFCQDLR